MKINRHNYEEFFVLYADGELDAEGRQSVEAFAALHPDLAEELELLKDLRLDADEMPAMLNKHTLLRHVPLDADKLSDNEQALLNMVDGELDAAALSQLEAEIAADPLLKAEAEMLLRTKLEAASTAMPEAWRMIHLAEWHPEKLDAMQQALVEAVDDEQKATQIQAGLATPEHMKEWYVLQQTRLQAEAVEMPNKQKLYKHRPQVIGIGWRKTLVRTMAAAAVMAGLGWFIFNQPDPVQQADAGNQVALLDKPATPATEDKKTNEATAKDQVAEVAAPSETKAIAATGSQQLAANTAQQQPVKQQQKTTTTVVNVQAPSEEEDMARLIASDRLRPEDEAMLRNQANLNTQPDVNVNSKVNNMSSQLAGFENEASEQPKAQYAVMKETDEEEFVTIAGARIPKQKLRGVFRTVSRKVTRSFERNDLNDIAANLK